MRTLFTDPCVLELEELLLHARSDLRRHWATTLALLPSNESDRWSAQQSPIDLECDRILRDVLGCHSLTIPVVSEERPFDCDLGAVGALLVDPLDGTHNANGGYPAYTSSVAYYRNGEYIFGWVYDACRDILFSAFRGDGAYLQTEYVLKRLRRVSQEMAIEDLCLGVLRVKNGHHASDMLFKRGRKIRISSCSSLDLCHVAAGSLDAFVDLNDPGHERTCDIAGAAVILSEAGGSILAPDGVPRRLLPPSIRATQDRTALIACAHKGASAPILELTSGRS